MGPATAASVGKGELCGYLMKRSKTNLSQWRKRWFVLKDDRIWYCKTHDKPTDVTYISLVGAYGIDPTNDKTALRSTFEINTPHRTYQLKASSDSEMNEWVTALRQRVEIVEQNEFMQMAARYLRRHATPLTA